MVYLKKNTLRLYGSWTRLLSCLSFFTRLGFLWKKNIIDVNRHDLCLHVLQIKRRPSWFSYGECNLERKPNLLRGWGLDIFHTAPCYTPYPTSQVCIHETKMAPYISSCNWEVYQLKAIMFLVFIFYSESWTPCVINVCINNKIHDIDVENDMWSTPWLSLCGPRHG